jgi:hypothetical protein
LYIAKRLPRKIKMTLNIRKARYMLRVASDWKRFKLRYKVEDATDDIEMNVEKYFFNLLQLVSGLTTV